MQFTHLNAFAGCGLLVLAACAQPEPVRVVAPEPVFDKYGNAVSECRPADQPVSATFPSTLPVCQPECPPGQTVAGAAPTYCVPIPGREGGDDPSGRRSPTGAAP